MTSRRVRWVSAVAALLFGAIGVVVWKAAALHAAVVKAIPPQPALAKWPAAFVADLASAGDRARRFWRPAMGLTRLARLYQANGFYDEAISCYQGLAEIEPSNPAWPYQLAGLLAGFGRIDEALPWQKRAVALAPQNAACHLRLGDLLLKHNDETAAMSSYATTLALDPGNAYARLGLARGEIRGGNGVRFAMKPSDICSPPGAVFKIKMACIPNRHVRAGIAAPMRAQAGQRPAPGSRRVTRAD